jgi:hypothetical protein
MFGMLGTRDRKFTYFGVVVSRCGKGTTPTPRPYLTVNELERRY